MVVRGTHAVRASGSRIENPRTWIMPMRTADTALRRSRGWAAMAAGLLLSLTLCRAIAAADLQVRVTQANGKPVPGAVVTVHALGAAPPAAAPVQAVMDQLDLAFTPDVLVIPVGSTAS